MKITSLKRETKETAVRVDLVLNSNEKSNIDTGIGFFDHMLEAMFFRAGLNASIKCKGDLYVDAHHTIEDVGICIGKALDKALGDKKGINRYANNAMPMDEALVNCAIDISGRSFLVFNAEFSAQHCGDFPTEMTEEFFRALSFNAGLTLHINAVYGKNTHHLIEAIFKAVGCAIGEAIKITGTGVPSTKGVL